MKKNFFFAENDRKDKLFAAWNQYLQEIHQRFSEGDFDEIYEGIATVSDLAKESLGVDLEDGRKLRHIPISSEIRAQTARLDSMYLVLGRHQEKWWPLDMISIASIGNIAKIDRIGKANGREVHFTLNPLLVQLRPDPVAH